MRASILLALLLVGCGGDKQSPPPPGQVKVAVTTFTVASQVYSPGYGDSSGLPNELLLSLRENAGSCQAGGSAPAGGALLVNMPWGVGDCAIGPAAGGSIHTSCMAAVTVVQVADAGSHPLSFHAVGGTVTVAQNLRGAMKGHIHALFPAAGRWTSSCTTKGTGSGTTIDCKCQDASGNSSTCSGAGSADCCPGAGTAAIDIDFDASPCAALCVCPGGAAICPCAAGCGQLEPFPQIDCPTSCAHAADVCTSCAGCVGLPDTCQHACEGAYEVWGSNDFYGCLASSTTCDSLTACMDSCHP